MNIKKHIPNFLTSMNLFCGCLAIVAAFQNNLHISAYLIGLAAIFDFFDGMSARLLHVKSDIGKDLDSLSDVVSFGVVPGVIMFKLLENISIDYNLFINNINIIPYFAFIIPVFSSLRLAKFNNDPRQTESFVGVPTPANAILIGSFPLILYFNDYVGNNFGFIIGLLQNAYFLLFITFLMSYLLIAEIPLFSLKVKNLRWNDNKIKYIFIFSSIFLIIIFKIIAIALIIIFYILLSIISNLIKKSK